MTNSNELGQLDWRKLRKDLLKEFYAAFRMGQAVQELRTLERQLLSSGTGFQGSFIVGISKESVEDIFNSRYSRHSYPESTVKTWRKMFLKRWQPA